MMINCVRKLICAAAALLILVTITTRSDAVNWDNGAGDFLWTTPGNWQENNMNGPGGIVPSNVSIFFDFGPIIVNAVVPSVKDVFVANAVPPPDPEDPNAASNHTELTIQQGGILTMMGGQLKVGAFTGFDSPSTGVTAAVTITGNGHADSQYGVVTNPLYHPTFGNISSTINMQDNAVLNAGTGVFFGGGNTTINMSGSAVFTSPNGFFEHVEGGNSPIYNPASITNPYGINAHINLSGNARFVVPNTGDFAVSEALANEYITAGLFQSPGGVTHFVEGDNRVVMANSLPGDYNSNGSVDAADYTVWRNTLGSTTDLRANGNKTGASATVIDNEDFVFWKSHFGAPGSGGAAGGTAIPEPGCCLLAFLAVWILSVADLRRIRPR